MQECWNGTEFDSEGVNASGRSGGLLSIWNKELFVKTEVIKNKCFLIVIGIWKGIDGKMIFANIYGPHNIPEKNALWLELIQLRNNIDGIWIFQWGFQHG